jgi:hypothetical protein
MVDKKKYDGFIVDAACMRTACFRLFKPLSGAAIKQPPGESGLDTERENQ